jgi:hypothetical protein
MGSGVRVRGVPISNEEACELARRLRSYGDPIGVGVAERLERGVLAGTAMVGTSLPEARVTLTVIERWAPLRLLEVQDSLNDYIDHLENGPSWAA